MLNFSYIQSRFEKSRVLVRINNSSLEVFLQGKAGKLEFSSKIVKNIEILDPDAFKSAVSTFLSKYNLKKRKAIILLADSIVFSKAFESKSNAELSVNANDFLDSIPFSPDKVSKKIVYTGSSVTVHTTNGELYRVISEILNGFECSVCAVVPASAAGIKDDKADFTTEDVKTVMRNLGVLRMSNFLISDADDHGGASSLENIVSLISILAIILSLAVILGVLKVIPFPRFSSQVSDQITFSQIPAAKMLPETKQASGPAQIKEEEIKKEEIKKEEIKIMVLNGSNVSGEAARTKELLESIGFASVGTGDAEGVKEAATVLVFNSKVPQNMRGEIIAILKNRFEEISVQKDISSGEFDVTISTGRIRKAA